MKGFCRKKKANKLKITIGLTLLFTLVFGFLLCVTLFSVTIITCYIYKLNIFGDRGIPELFQISLFVSLCIIVGSCIAMVVSRFVLSPIRRLIRAMNKISKGDYTVRIEEKGFLKYTNIACIFNRMAMELSSVEQMQAEFINNFSHEFKTPISSMLGFAKLLKKSEVPYDEKCEYVDIIISESERLASLSHNILSLTRVEKQAILTDVIVYNVSEQIRQAISLLDNKLSEKNINISLEGIEAEVYANKSMLEQVWINLLDNAVKFSPEGSDIIITVSHSEEGTSVCIKDSGPGMDEETAKRVFDKFFQGDLSHTTTGYGLGLAICKKIVQLHDGIIRVKSTDKTGTVFEVVLN